MKIDIIANDGSPLGVTEQSIYGMDGRNGVGGAELAILTLCKGWKERGHEVTFYNDPYVHGGSTFEQKPLSSFRGSHERDVLIIFRSPNDRANGANGKKVWFSCDQFTIGDFAAFSKRVDKVVCISEYHKHYFESIYGIFGAHVIDLPVRTWEYEQKEKVKNSCIFSSVPDRGLMELLPIWRNIVRQVPDATLTITSDWSLWSGADASGAVSPYRVAWAGVPGVIYKGAVRREELIEIQSKSEFHLYPHMAQYPELFCIAVAESQVAGAIPITSVTGAINTTNRFGYRIEGIPTNSDFRQRFSDKAVELMNSERPLPDISQQARVEFGLDRILDEWERIFRD